MELRQYARVLRAQWHLLALGVVTCMVMAAALAWHRAPIYEAKIQFFVSNSAPSDLSQAYAGSQFSQQRVSSYAQIISSPRVVGAVIEQLALPDSIDEIQREIHASAPTGTVLIDVTVNDRSPGRAKAIADALASQFSSFVDMLETPRGEQNSPVKVSVASPAQLPTAAASPDKPLYLALGALLGLVLGLVGLVLREGLSTRIHAEDDAAAVAGVRVLGSVAEARRRRNRSPIIESFSTQAEAYRRLRMNLMVVWRNGRLPSLVVTSAVAGEGKTQIAANLGIVFAHAGQRVVLVDANLRRPRLAEAMGLPPAPGLTSVLRGEVSLEEALRDGLGDLTLQLLGSGPPAPNPSELLSSEAFASVLRQLTNRADLVILDTPPLLEVSDPAIVARLGGGVVIVTRADWTGAQQLESAVESLHSVEARLLGLVFNRTRVLRGRR